MTHGKNPPMDYEEMTELVEAKQGGRIYRAESGEYVSGEIARLVELNTTELAAIADGIETVSLFDTRAVEMKAIEFLRVCGENSIIPTLTSFCHVLGYSEEGVRRFRSQHPGHRTTEFLTIFHEKCSEVLNQAALRNLTNYTYSIFVQKAKNGYRDTITVETMPQQPESYDTPAEEIALKYAQLPQD